jgi:prepilin-type N-terminal cleavage/methylation domain-containing protein
MVIFKEYMPRRTAIRGFTLIELSIALVIIGLLTGGILVGQELIEQSKIRVIMNEKIKIESAVMAFRDKYGGVPGDLTNATTFWGAQADCSYYGTPDGTAATCNGDGNGQIQTSSGTTTPADREENLLWQHLSDAGMINGHYNGDVRTYHTGLNDGFYDNGVSRFSPQAKWRVFWVDRSSIGWYDKYFTTVTAGNYFELAQGLSVLGNTYPIITPQEALAVDTKWDDGQAGTGRITGPGQHYHSGNADNCTTSLNAQTAQYNTAYTVYDATTVTNGATCILIIKAGF